MLLRMSSGIVKNWAANPVFFIHRPIKAHGTSNELVQEKVVKAEAELQLSLRMYPEALGREPVHRRSFPRKISCCIRRLISNILTTFFNVVAMVFPTIVDLAVELIPCCSSCA